MKHLAYPKYKNSGINWIGDIPESWTIDRIKASIKSCNNGIWGDEPAGDKSDTICVRVADFNRSNLSVDIGDPTLRNISEKEKSNRTLKKGDLLIEKSGGGENQPVGCVVLYDFDAPAVCSNFIAKMTLKEDMDSSFWRYLHFAAYSIRLTIGSINQTSGIQNLDQDRYFDEKVPFPTLEEQQKIAKYLDRETVKIDELIHKQEELIKLLREERATRIKHAIKNGLKENVEMVSSSLIKGERVPKHWKVAQLKRNVEFLNNQRVPLSTEERSYRQGEYPYYGASGIIDYVDDYIYEESLILIGEDGANLLSRSSPLAFEAHGKYWVNNHAHILRPKDGLLDYWTFLLENHNYTCEVSGSAQPKLTIDALANIRFFTPGSIVEKREISDYCTSISQKIDCLIDKSRISIDLLREHRASLISAAVTGKIDVRELV